MKKHKLYLSLRAHLLMATLLPAALLTIVISLLFIHNSNHSTEQALRNKSLAMIDFLAPAAEYGIISRDIAVISNLLNATLNQAEITASIAFDASLQTLSVEGKPLLEREAAELLLLKTTTTSAHIVVEGKQRLGVAAPVYFTPVAFEDDPLPGENAAHIPIGWVYLEIDTSNLLAQQTQTIIKALLLTTLGLFAFALIALRLGRHISAPIRTLSSAVEQMDGGDLHIRATSKSVIPELNKLIQGFNHMAHTIQNTHETMQARIREATKKLEWQALHDPLTGLQNRRAFEQDFQQIIDRAKNAADYRSKVLCMIDLDRFKIVNDSCGHAAGDRLLRNLTHLIEENVRKDDVLYRIGGDEFALVLHNCKTQAAWRIVDNLRELVSQYRFNWEGRRFSIGTSIGLVGIEKGFAGTLDSAQRAADDACYAAKRAGRNRIVVHGKDSAHNRRQSDLSDNLLITNLPAAQKRFLLYRQRIVSTQVESTHWYEILLRMDRDAEHVYLASDILANIDGNSPTLYEVDCWVASAACAALQTLPADENWRFSLNISEASLLSGTRYLAHLKQLLEQHQIAAERIVLEFPTRLAIMHAADSIAFVRRAHEAGCSIALEHFNDSISNVLSELRPDFIKISIHALAANYDAEASQNIIRALYQTARALDIQCIASEAEDPALSLDTLASQGFVYAQGYQIETVQPLLRDQTATMPPAA